MIHKLFFLTTTLILPLMAVPATRPSEESTTQPSTEMVAADFVAERFVQALKTSHWADALSCCSPQLQDEAKRYPSVEAFFRQIVPVQELINKPELPIYRWNSKVRKWAKGTPHVLVAKVEKSPYLLELENRPDVTWAYPVYWIWNVQQLNSKWVVDFTVTPLQMYVDREVAREKRDQEKRVADEKALEPILRDVHTQLTPLRKQFKTSESMPLRLELINGGPGELIYDDVRVGLYCSRIVKDEQGKLLPCIIEPVQTGSAHKLLHPAQTDVLLDHWDLRAQYKLTKPGRYTVQFSGHGLHISEADPHKTVRMHRSPTVIETVPDVGRRSSRLFPSNIVEIEVVSTQPE